MMCAGPGAYDPKAVKDIGFKADPKSGFLTGERFGEDDSAQPQGAVMLTPDACCALHAKRLVCFGATHTFTV